MTSAPLLDTLFFYAFAALALAGAVLTVTRKNAVRSAIWLIASLLGVAGLFLLQQAEFLFAVQIVLYIGGIMVLFLFVIMLVNLDQAAKSSSYKSGWPVAILCTAAVAGEIAYIVRKGAMALPLPPVVRPAAEGNTERLGTALFQDYLLPFEIASVLLLVAIVGSVVMGQRRRA